MSAVLYRFTLINWCTRFIYVIWVDATSDDTAKQSFKSIVNDSDLRIPGIGDSPELVLKRLSRIPTQWLLIIDNADRDTPDEIESYLPYGAGSNAIITSRNPGMERLVGPEGHAQVDTMDEAEAITLLLLSACLNALECGYRSTAKKIISELHFLVLAIDQAGSYIGQGYCSLSEYLYTYRKQKNRLLNNGRLGGASQYDRAVYGTWDVSLGAIKRRSTQGPATQKTAATNGLLILRLFAIFHYDNISDEIFRRAAVAANDSDTLRNRDDPGNKLNRTYSCLPRRILALDESGEWDPRDFREGIQILVSLSLVKRSPSRAAYSLHPLVYAWCRQKVKEIDMRLLVRSGCTILSYSYQRSKKSREVEGYLFAQALAPHVTSVSQFVGMQSFLEMIGDLECENFFLVNFAYGETTTDATFAESMLKKRAKVLGSTHWYTVQSMRSVAICLSEIGNQPGAEKLYKELLKIYKSSMGDKYEKTLRITVELAKTRMRAGRYKAAEGLLLPALRVMREVLGEESLDVIDAKLLFAHLCERQMRFSKDEKLYNELLRKITNLQNESDIPVLAVKTDFALLCLQRCKYPEAESVSKQALETSSNAYGEDDPVTLIAKSTFAKSLMHQGRLHESNVLFNQILQKRREIMGDEHIVTVETMCNIGKVKRVKGELMAAKDIFESVYQVEGASSVPWTQRR